MPTDSYQISSTCPSLRPSSRSLLTPVSFLKSALTGSKLSDFDACVGTRSERTSVGLFEADCVPTRSPPRLRELKERICAPRVNCRGMPPETDTNQRFCEPRSSVTKKRPPLSSSQKTFEGARSNASVRARLFDPSEFIK